MIETTKIQPVKVDYKCPVCKQGYLRPTGRTLMTHPAKYPHRCNKQDCDFEETFSGIQYPYIDYIKE